MGLRFCVLLSHVIKVVYSVKLLTPLRDDWAATDDTHPTTNSWSVLQMLAATSFSFVILSFLHLQQVLLEFAPVVIQSLNDLNL